MKEPLKTLDVELAESIDDIGGLAGYWGIHVLVRLRGIPLGYVWSRVEENVASASALFDVIRAELGHAILRRLGQANAPVPHDPGMLQLDDLRGLPPRKLSSFAPEVTVAICTRDRVEYLATCLDSVCRLDYRPLEILVVDNAPETDDTLKMIESDYPGVRYVREVRPGLNWARNRAIVEAAGDVVAFADDDVEVDSRWIHELVSGLADDHAVMAVTGLVAPLELMTRAQVEFERYGGFGSGFERMAYGPVKNGLNHSVHFQRVIEFSTGANMAFRKKAFDLAGRFDPALDVGTVTNGGGDIEMFLRLLKEGYGLVYQPSAIVRHRHRREEEELLKQIESWGSGFIAVLERIAISDPKERLACIWIALRWLSAHCRDLFRSILTARRWHCRLVLAELRGAVRGLGAYRRARRTARQIESNHGSPNMQ